MSAPENYARVKDIFLAARRLPKGDRTPFLDASCADEPGLVDQVRKLLTLDEQEIPSFDSPAPGAGLAPGAHLGRFRVERLLGEGGMGVVYEAQEDEPARRVALKIIRPGLLSARLRARFRHEIRILGQLRHPGIAQIYEAGTLEHAGQEVPYFAMELVQGRPLLECAGSLSIRERLALVAQIGDAVHHAHQKGVIHRDLKPGNILVEQGTDSTAPGAPPPLQIKILDFGIARLAEPDSRTVSVHTEPGQLVGTIPYMSPEQVAGDADALDIRTDVYSLGVIAFELLSGRLPYPVRERLLPEAVRLIHDAEPARLGSIDRSLRGDVETIIAKALDKEPSHRYQSAAEFAADLRRHLRDEPIVARPASALYQIRKFARRHRPLVAAAAVVLLTLVAATIVSAWQARVALHAKALADSEKTRANLSADAARREAARATLNAAAAAIESGNPIDARRALDSADETRRGWPWKYWHARLDESIAAMPVTGRIVGAWAGPGGAEVIIVTEDGRILRQCPWAEAPKTGPRLALSPVGPTTFTADGAQIIAACGPERRSLDIFDAADGRALRHVADLPAPGALIVASADAAEIAVAVKGIGGAPIADDVWLWNAASPGRLVRQKTRTTGLALTPDGRWLAACFGDLACWDTARDGPVWTRTLDREDSVLAISDDGSRLASGGVDKTIRIWDRASNETPPPLRGHAGDITALCFDPAGRTLASSATDLTIRLWDVTTGAPLAALAGHTARIRTLWFTADGSRLLSISDDGSARLWQARPYEDSCILRGHTSYVYAVAFTPDGSRIVSGAWDHSIRIWDAAGGNLLRTIPAGYGFITTLAVSADGTTIATGHKIGEWEPAQVRLWSASTGAELGHVAIGVGELHNLILNRAGTRLWAGWEHGGLATSDLSTKPLSSVPVLTGRPTWSVALSPDERLIAQGGDDGSIQLLDAASGRPIRQWPAHAGAVRSLAFCPTRPILASGSADSTIRLWNLDSGALVATLDRHWGPVYALAFSPDGAALASGSDDTTIRLWDPDTGAELTRLRAHEAYVYSLAFSPDGSRLASASGDRTVRVWDTRPVRDRWAARATPAGP